MANKKKMEQLEAERKTRQARYVQIGGVGIVLVLIVVGFWLFGSKKQDQSIIVKGQTACQNFSVIAKADSYTAAPPLGIDVKKQFFATVKLAKGGEFVIQLYPDKAPKTVNSFVFLACRGYFNGLTFHRVLDGFMAQTGDPTGAGSGGPGYEFEYEANDLKFDKAGVVAMANTGPATPTNGSQFFITFGATPNLDDGYTIFGQVTKGMDVVNAITRRDPQTNPSFTGDAMESVTITEQ